MKEIDRQNYQFSSIFSNLIISDKYLIQECKIYYLWEDTPYSDGILNMEQLEDQTTSYESKDLVKDFIKGPMNVTGSDQFSCIYNDIEK